MIENYLKQVAFLGLGTFSASREKIETGIAKLVKKGELTAAQGKTLTGKLIADAERMRKAISKKIDEGVKAGLAKAGVVRIKDTQALKRRIEQLEKRLAAHEARPVHTKPRPRPTAK